MKQQNTCKEVCIKPAPTPHTGSCQLGCDRCGYNWYKLHYNNGSPTRHWNQYCNCCKGTMKQQNTCKAVCIKKAPTPDAGSCELGCNRCGYNWYEKHYNNGSPTEHWNKYCNCCEGTMEQQNTCKGVCTNWEPTHDAEICELGCNRCGYNWHDGTAKYMQRSMYKLGT